MRLKRLWCRVDLAVLVEVMLRRRCALVCPLAMALFRRIDPSSGDNTTVELLAGTGGGVAPPFQNPRAACVATTLTATAESQAVPFSCLRSHTPFLWSRSQLAFRTRPAPTRPDLPTSAPRPRRRKPCCRRPPPPASEMPGTLHHAHAMSTDMRWD